MADLRTSYMGLELRNPIIVASSDLTKSAEKIKECENAGAGAVVLKSLFEEQFVVEAGDMEEMKALYPEALDYLRSGSLTEYGPGAICDMIENLKKDISIPVIASINCQTPKLWSRYASQLAKAGADALELNVYSMPVDLSVPGSEIEESYLKILRAVKESVEIPISIKLIPEITSLPNLAHKLAEADCKGLVLFNWFLQPDIDINTLRSRSLKGVGNFHQSLRWVALLSGRIKTDLAASGGIRGVQDVIKQILAGASTVQIATLFYQKSLLEIQNIIRDLDEWMKKSGFSSIEDFKGELSFKNQELSSRSLGEAESYFRAQYLKSFSGTH